MLDYLDPASQLRTDVERIHTELSGVHVFSIVVDSGIDNTFLQVKYLDQVLKIQDFMAGMGEFDRTFSFANFVSMVNSVMADEGEDDGELWLPVVPGSRARIEMFVPADRKFDPEIGLTHIGYGYRDWFKMEAPILRQGACNNDVICPEGDPWRDEIASVAVYQLNGFWTCTGTMVMNTASDYTPLFLTANHCGISSGNDHTMVVYWNFESPNCGDLCCGSLSDNQTGAIFRAARSDVDMCLVELEEDPNLDHGVYWAGWDNSGTAPVGCVAIHHPSTDEKAISFNDDLLTTNGVRAMCQSKAKAVCINAEQCRHPSHYTLVIHYCVTFFIG